MTDRRNTTDGQRILEIYQQLDERDRRKLMLAAQSLLAVAEDKRRRLF